MTVRQYLKHMNLYSISTQISKWGKVKLLVLLNTRIMIFAKILFTRDCTLWPPYTGNQQ